MPPEPAAPVLVGTGSRCSRDHPPDPGVFLAVLCAAAFMASLDVFIVNVAFDDIGHDFHGASLSDLSWILNGYAIVYAALLVPLGRLADRYGRKAGFLARAGAVHGGQRGLRGSTGLWMLVAFRPCRRSAPPRSPRPASGCC